MKIGVMGAGALGGYFGARLAASGQDVWFIARGAHLDAMRQHGLKVLSEKGNLHLTDVNATDDPAKVGPVDVVLFMVKNYDVASAAVAIRPMLGPGTMVVTCQNGVSAHERLGEVIGHGHVVPGVVRMPADIAEPGVIRHPAQLDGIVFGEPDGRASDRVERLRNAFEQADGVTVQVPGSILHDLWAKFTMQACFASITALTRCNIGPLRSDESARDLMTRAMMETEAVGRAVVPDLPDGLVGRAWAVLDSLPPGTHASMLDDLTRGKPIEVDYLSGDVVRIGQRHGIPTPIHDVFWRALSPMRDGLPD